MTRQTELDRQWHETGYEEMGIGFNHEPTEQQDMLTCEDYDPDLDGPGHDLDTAKVQAVSLAVLRLLAKWTLERLHIVKEGNHA